MPNDGSIVIGTEVDESGFQKGLKGLTGIAKAGGIAIGAAIGLAVGGTVAFSKAAVDAGSKFDASMSQVAATMGVTVDQIDDLRQYAIDMGATTAFSATEVADALNYMALAGYDAEQSMQALPNVLNLAAAGNIGLARASDMVTDAQSALGLSFEESAQLVDKMAKASSKSNTSVAQLGDAILTVGGTAKNLAGGTTELTTVLGLLADNGIKGAEGGTALRNVILSLSAPTDKAKKAMKDLGLEVYDAEGKMRPMGDIMADLNGVLADMTQGEQTEVLNTLFNKVDLKSVNALLGTNVKRWKELSGAIDDAQGAAQTMAETQLDNLTGDVTLFKSALEGAQITLSDQLTPTLRKFVQFGTAEIGKLDKAFQSGGVKGFAAQLGTSLGDAVGMISDYAPQFIEAALAAAGAVFGSIFGKLKESFPDILIFVGDLLEDIGDTLLSALPDIVGGIGEMVGQLLANSPRLLMIGVELIAKIAAGILQGIPALVEGIANGLVGMFAEPVSREVRESEKHLSDLKTKFEEIQQKFDEGLNGDLIKVEENGKTAEYWLGIYDQLYQKTDLTKEEQLKLNEAVDALNEIMPDIGLHIDDETGKWSLNTKEIKKNIDMMVNRAKADVYLKKSKDLIEKIVEAEIERDKASDRANETGQKLSDVTLQYNKAKSGADELRAAINDVTSGAKSFNDVKLSDNVKAIAKEVGISTDNFANWRNILTYANASAENLGKSVSDLTKEYGNDVEAVNTCTRAIQGYEGQVDKMVGKAAEYTKAAEETGKQLPKSISEGVGLGEVALTDAAKKAIQKAAEAAKQEAKEKGQEPGKAYAEAQNKAIADKTEAVKKSGKSLIDSASLGAMGTDPKGKGKEVGKAFGDGVTVGIEESKPKAVSAGVATIKATVDSMKSFAMIKSPSKLFRDEVGVYMGLGVAEGLLDGMAGIDDMLDSRIQATVADAQASIADAEAVGGAMKAIGGTDTEPRYVETTINIDGRETAKVISPYVSKEVAWQSK